MRCHRNLNCRTFLALISTLILVSVMGCNRDWPSPVAGSAKVNGKVTLDGAPVDNARVVFLPNSLRNGQNELMPVAYGSTNAEGKFELAYSDGSSDLLVGNYVVIISKVDREDEEGDQPSPWQSDLLPESVSMLSAFNDVGQVIPAIYNRNSSLTYEVPGASQSVSAVFELSSIDPVLEELPVIDLPLK